MLNCVDTDMFGLAGRDVYTVWMPTCTEIFTLCGCRHVRVTELRCLHCGCRPVRVSGQRCLHCVDAELLGLADRCLHCVDADMLGLADRDVYTA